MKPLLFSFLLFALCSAIYCENGEQDVSIPNSLEFDPSLFLLLDGMSVEDQLCIIWGEIPQDIADKSFALSIFPGFGEGHKTLGRESIARFFYFSEGFSLLAGPLVIGCVFAINAIAGNYTYFDEIKGSYWIYTPAHK